MSDIRDFLQSRILEDEIVARELPDGGRWLSHCLALRMILALHATAVSGGTDAEAHARCSHDRAPFPCPTLRAVLVPYMEHPAFRADWLATAG